MKRQRKSSSGDIPVMMPEGKTPRRPPSRGWLIVLAVIVVVTLLGLLWRQVMLTRP